MQTTDQPSQDPDEHAALRLILASGLTLGEEDRRVRDWFRAECESLGCSVHVDEVGNMFARRAGKDDSLLPIAMGSHLDTQPTGGKFDGVLGVLGALEALRTMVEMGYETTAPIELVNWTNEEGSRFAPAMLCSGVYAGVFTPEFAYSREDREGKKFGEEIQTVATEGEFHVVEYVWPRPGETEAVPKETYVTKVGDQVCVVGYYP